MRWLAVLGLGLLVSCASVDFDHPKGDSFALMDTADTRIGRTATAEAQAHPGRSGFMIQSHGVEALATRLLLAERAERSLDAQYYLITADEIGMAFFGSLLKAADRGVRVRLLLDDIQTTGYDAGLAGLDSHPNLEVRIFNPFAGRKSKIGDGLKDFGRVNRRMHNKSFTVDNQITLVGGRNIAAEYFAAHDDVNFSDADVLAVGPVVQDVSRMFDLYWNHPAAAPLPAFADMPDDPAEALASLRAAIDEAVRDIGETPYAAAFDRSLDRVLTVDRDSFVWAPYQLVYDSPDKSDPAKADRAASIVTPLREAVLGAEEELIIISPYFVPLRNGIEALVELEDRGVEVVVVTNSLAANNHSVVHSGYAPSRKPLLAGGAELLEARTDATPSGVDTDRAGMGATLHTKAFVVDRRQLFIGSFNWDPRSVDLNTELGVIINSPELAGGIVRSMMATADDWSYEVVLNERGKLRWVDRSSGDEERVLEHDPDTGVWTRFGVWLMGLLPIKAQL